MSAAHQECMEMLKRTCCEPLARKASMKPVKPVSTPVLATVDALQEMVLRQHQLTAIEELGEALGRLGPMLKAMQHQIVLHGLKGSVTLAEIAAGQLYHDLAEAVAASEWASSRLAAGAVENAPQQVHGVDKDQQAA